MFTLHALEPAYPVLLALHILAGTLALVSGLGAMLTRKGALGHRRWGRLYFWSMAAIFATSIVMSVMHQRAFLFIVAFFSFYLSFAGYRTLYARKPQQRAAGLDWLACVIALVTAAGFWWWSAAEGSAFGTIAQVFGGIIAAFALADGYRFLRPSSDPKAWRYAHMGRMLGAYIATFTAFAVVNLRFLPPLWVWLTPTVVGTVGISAWIAYYRIQDAARSKSST